MANTAQLKTLTKVHAKNIFYLLNGKPLPENSNSGRQSSSYYSYESGLGYGVNPYGNTGDQTSSHLETPNFFTTGSSSWKLKGASCFNFETKLAFHLNLAVTPGRTPDRVKLVMHMTECCRNEVNDLPNRLKKLVVKLSFHDAQDHVLHTNCIQIDPRSSWEELKATYEDFMPAETLWKMCRFKIKGESLPSISKNVKADWEFEFVKLTAELELSFTAGPHSLLKLTKCELDTARYLPSTTQFYTVSTCESKIEGRTILKPVSRGSSSSKGSTSKDSTFAIRVTPVQNTGRGDASNSQSSSGEGHENGKIQKSRDQQDLALPVHPKETVVEKERNFSEMVTFKVGPDGRPFMAYKYKIMSLSPVFEKMLTVDMKEKSENVIPLKEEDPKTVQNFLSLLSSNTNEDFNDIVLEMPAPEILDLLEFAHMYELTQLLKDLTTAFVSMPYDKLTVEAVLGMFVAGCQFEMPDLKFRALQLIKTIKSHILGGGREEFKRYMAVKDPEYLCNLIFELL